jgi:hypothetical protein
MQKELQPALYLIRTSRAFAPEIRSSNWLCRFSYVTLDARERLQKRYSSDSDSHFNLRDGY